ncbi:MAG TPA: hypothetical protein ENH82_18290 [bacterium]|nr:hypothetical protein [bacterium]
MKKTRTLEIRKGGVYYRGQHRGTLTCFIKDYFKLPYSGKVQITIGEEGPYTFKLIFNNTLYEVGKDSQYIGVVCGKEFERLFFKPDGDKGYDIIVKEVK